MRLFDILWFIALRKAFLKRRQNVRMYELFNCLCRFPFPRPYSEYIIISLLWFC